jgi:adenosylcobyric acid synthase
MPACLMLQGAGSNVGKSVLVAGLCRYFANAGLTVRPFKPQNMSNNAAVTADGGEIGRAQAMQARGCRAETSVHMNPVLLKPESETGSQIIVQGKRFGSMRAREYGSHKAELLPRVLESFEIVGRNADLVIVEGAGSPAEVNLRAGDIANMGFAVAADVPVVMVGDIDRGGVIASLVGTDAVLDAADRALIKGFLINKFRGDTALFAEGISIIEQATGWQGVGILPWFPEARFLPAEDILDIKGKAGQSRHGAPVKVAVPVLRRIANFDDLDPLAGEEDVDVMLVEAGEPIPGDADLILLPGSKSTISDLGFLRDQGWDIDIRAHLRRGGVVMGLCGGYQMLGMRLDDPDGVEGAAGSVAGLGHLDVETVLAGDKTLTRVSARAVRPDAPVTGYEIHMGRTGGADCERPFLRIDSRPEGAVSADGAVIGSYLHGIFADDVFRRAFLDDLAARRGRPGRFGVVDFEARVDDVLDDLAAHMAQNLDLDRLGKIAGL